MKSPVMVYFFHAPGRIKIGISKNVKTRLAAVGSHMEQKPTLLGYVKGCRDLEQHLHSLLSEHRIQGEWFSDCDEVRAFMARVLDGETFAAEIKARKAARSTKAPFVYVEPTSEERLAMFNRVVALVYPVDPVGGMAEDLELNRDDVRDWLTGAVPMPFVVANAFGARLLLYIGGSLKAYR